MQPPTDEVLKMPVVRNQKTCLRMKCFPYVLFLMFFSLTSSWSWQTLPLIYKNTHVLQKLPNLLHSHFFCTTVLGLVFKCATETSRMSARWWKEGECTAGHSYLLKYGILVVTECHLILYEEHCIMDSQEKYVFSDSVIKEGTPFQLRYKVVWIKESHNLFIQYEVFKK